jgi:fructose transport system substrate-binding protein
MAGPRAKDRVFIKADGKVIHPQCRTVSLKSAVQSSSVITTQKNQETFMKFPTIVIATLLAGVGASAATTAIAATEPVIGLITKTETNPFFVKMKEGAQIAAKADGAKLLTGAGKFENDNSGQVTVIENMIAAGARTILITPTDSKAIVPAIKKARDQGVMVIALDSPTEPQEAVDALYATDNFKAGVLIGQYAKAAFAGKKARIAMLDLFPGHAVGTLRHNGFLSGFGMAGIDAKSLTPATGGDIVCAAEPAAAGAFKALQAAGKEKGVMIVSIDGGCAGIKDVQRGAIAATSQQYPLKMAEMGVDAGVAYARTGKKVSGYHDTGVTLIAGKPVAGVDSKDAKFGLGACWGNK